MSQTSSVIRLEIEERCKAPGDSEDAGHRRANMRALRITIGKLFAVALLTLCVGVQALEASGRWDRTFQDSGDEAVLVTVVLCIGAALLAADAIRRRLSPTAIPSAIPRVCSTPRAAFEPPAAGAARSTSPPLSLRI